MFLEGKNVCPLDTQKAKDLIGKPIRYLRKSDIDKSGRGYFFPRSGLVKEIYKRHVVLDNGEMLPFSNLVELICTETKWRPKNES